MSTSTLLFGATSILGFNIARLFPETVLPFPSPNGRTGHHDSLRYRTQRKLRETFMNIQSRSMVLPSENVLRMTHLETTSENAMRHVSATRVISSVDLAKYLLTPVGQSANYS